MNKQLIKLGHSPDPDDAFMFYGLACGAVDSGPFEFEHVLRDIQTLNDWACDGRLEVTAISVHAYPYVQDKYAILSSGASMGATALADYESDDGRKIPAPPTAPTDAHGPLVVAAEPIPLEELARKTIAIPGTMTSAFLTLQLALGQFDYLVMMFDEIPEAVRQGKVDAGLIIHEGQLTYEQLGLCCLIDLGRWWHDQTHLPLPLGCNVIRRDLGSETIGRVSSILKSSIEYGLTHRPQAVEYALEFGRGLDVSLADKFVGMYVNEWTVNFGPLGRRAVDELLRRGSKAKLVPEAQDIQYV
jgi:1,4-dihydroxy-6-naphthoate synthase